MPGARRLLSRRRPALTPVSLTTSSGTGDDHTLTERAWLVEGRSVLWQEVRQVVRAHRGSARFQ
jgi:hypothetical protein